MKPPTVALVVLASFLAGEAAAQDREGLMGGFAIGGSGVFVGGTSTDLSASIVAEDTAGGVGPGFTLHLGGMFTPRAAVLTPLETGRGCGYHDEARSGDRRFQGTVTVR